MSKHDQAALDAATQIIDLFSSPGQWRDTWHLKHKVQCLLIDLLERNAAQPAAGEPVYQIEKRDMWEDVSEEQQARCKEFGYQVRTLWTAPPAAAHGDEAVRDLKDSLEKIKSERHVCPCKVNGVCQNHNLQCSYPKCEGR